MADPALIQRKRKRPVRNSQPENVGGAAPLVNDEDLDNFQDIDVEDAMMDDNENNDDGAVEDEEMDQVINVDFEFFNQQPKDFHSIKTLTQGILGVPFNCSELADMITSAAVGSAIKSEGCDSEALGFITALNLSGPAGCLQEIRQFILKYSGTAQQQVAKILEEGHVGLILNQRIFNLPLELVHPLHKQLFEEIEEEEHLDSLAPKFQHFVLISSFLDPLSKKAQSAPQRKRVKQESEREYLKPEEEAYVDLSECHFFFPKKRSGDEREERWAFGGMVKEKGVVAFVPRETIPKVLLKIEEICK